MSDQLQDYPAIQQQLPQQDWLVACLCAAWCGTCGSYRSAFNELAQRHPDKCFVWIDVEDQADWVNEIDVENFPTILVQRRDYPCFFGTMRPDTQQLHKLLNALNEQGEHPSQNLQQALPTGWNLRQILSA